MQLSKPSTLLTLSLLIATGCTNAIPQKAIYTAPKTFKITLLNDGWMPGEQLVLNDVSKHKSRKGTTSSGSTYTYYKSGNGSIRPLGGDIFTGNWSFSCSIDKITDKTECELTAYDAELFITFTPDIAPKHVCILGHNFPGRTGVIRVDTNTPIKTDEEGCVKGSRVFKQLLNGKKVTTRMVKWPDDFNRDKQTALLGFSETITLWRFLRNNIDKIKF